MIESGELNIMSTSDIAQVPVIGVGIYFQNIDLKDAVA